MIGDDKQFCVFLQVLPDEHSRDMCLRFADMESKLGEIDRARAIYSYCSQICDPRVSSPPPVATRFEQSVTNSSLIRIYFPLDVFIMYL